MPLRIQYACATYNRMMRRVLGGMEQIDNSVDDVISFTGEWMRYLEELRQLFNRVWRAGLTVNGATSVIPV